MKSPSPSVVASVGIGVPLATICGWVVSLFGLEMPGPVQAAFGAVLSSVVGYFFPGGQGR